MQTAFVVTGALTISVSLPEAETEVIPGVCWGRLEAFPTPAYWAYQVLARRIENRTIRYRLGASLREEVGACLLGGHGIPARVGIAAFEHLKQRGAFQGGALDEATLHRWLTEPIRVDERSIRYRFASQKARYLAGALKLLDAEPAPLNSGRMLRDWLLRVPGIGYKTASWIARNWLDADDVAILDIHLLRAGVLGGFLDPALTVERDYLTLEAQFLAFSEGLGVRASELDAVIWLEMMASPLSVAHILDNHPRWAVQTKARNGAIAGLRW